MAEILKVVVWFYAHALFNLGGGPPELGWMESVHFSSLQSLEVIFPWQEDINTMAGF